MKLNISFHDSTCKYTLYKYISVINGGNSEHYKGILVIQELAFVFL